MNVVKWIEREEKAHLVKELVQGYKDRISEDKHLALEWETTSKDGIE